MHPALRRHVAPPSIPTGRYIAAGALTGFAGILFTLALVRLGEVELGSSNESAARSHVRDHRTLAASEAVAIDAARLASNRYAYLAYPGWVAAHPDRACPSYLTNLDAYVPNAHAFDPWGMAYRFDCNGRSFTVSSAGPDRAYGTADDIRGSQ